VVLVMGMHKANYKRFEEDRRRKQLLEKAKVKLETNNTTPMKEEDKYVQLEKDYKQLKKQFEKLQGKMITESKKAEKTCNKYSEEKEVGKKKSKRIQSLISELKEKDKQLEQQDKEINRLTSIEDKYKKINSTNALKRHYEEEIETLNKQISSLKKCNLDLHFEKNKILSEDFNPLELHELQQEICKLEKKLENKTRQEYEYTLEAIPPSAIITFLHSKMSLLNLSEFEELHLLNKREKTLRLYEEQRIKNHVENKIEEHSENYKPSLILQGYLTNKGGNRYFVDFQENRHYQIKVFKGEFIEGESVTARIFEDGTAYVKEEYQSPSFAGKMYKGNFVSDFKKFKETVII
jgi:myosin heavy subunit